MRPFSAACAAALLWVASPMCASEVLGPTYPVIEPDMLDEMKKHALELERSGELKRRLEEGNRRAEDSLRSPRAVPDLAPAFIRRTIYFDPTLTVNEDIVTPGGVVIARRGDRINPLRQVSWSGLWFFFNASDPAQLREAQRLISEHRGLVKPVLVGGSYIEATRTLAHRVYFDQQGALVRRFGIKAVPATVRQEGLRLRIDEYPARS